MTQTKPHLLPSQHSFARITIQTKFLYSKTHMYVLQNQTPSCFAFPCSCIHKISKLAAVVHPRSITPAANISSPPTPNFAVLLLKWNSSFFPKSAAKSLKVFNPTFRDFEYSTPTFFHDRAYVHGSDVVWQICRETTFENSIRPGVK
jgi:hypothetical protein